MNSPKNDTNKKSLAGLALLVLTVVIVGTLFVASDGAKSSRAVATTGNGDSGTNVAKYKDGTYMATGSYDSPGGTEKLYVTLTLANGVVKSSAIKSGSQENVSMSYQEQFIDNYMPKVIGKAIESLKIGSLAGSSLTGMGFNDAVKQIETQAKA